MTGTGEVLMQNGTDISIGNAMSYVAGYCLGLDMTTRGPEDRSFRKSIDGYGDEGLAAIYE